MNEVQTHEATAPLWRVNFQYVAGIELRAGTLIIPAETSAEAEAAAGNYFATSEKKHARVTTIKRY